MTDFDDMDNIFNLTEKDITDKDAPPKKEKSENLMHLENDIEINKEFSVCLDIMENTHNHIFITGDAGTGKSTLLRHFVNTTSKKVVVVAPTGVAAVNIGGQTIHSFFRFPPKPLTESNIPLIDEKYSMLYKIVTTIVIDEVSMVRVDLMDAIDIFLRTNLNSEEPFAGKQIIMFGDLNQLPPVVAQEAEREMIMHKYKSRYFFDAEVFTKISFDGIKLTKIFRQKDKVFINLLNSIKDNTIKNEGIDSINERMITKLEDDVITLCSTNAVADHINNMMLSKVHGEEYTLTGNIIGEFNTKYCNVDENITVKIGCRVMILVNHKEKKWYNGTIGELTDVNPEKHSITVLIDGKYYEIEKHEYEYTKYRYDREKGDISSVVSGTFTQFPIRVAYGITIHKSQGKTFERINIDAGLKLFAHGQLYVALSRCTTLQGITLSRGIDRSDIICDGRIIEFHGFLGKGIIDGKQIDESYFENYKLR